jgi:hypothetical protein
MGSVPPRPNRTRTKQSHYPSSSAAPFVPPTFASTASIGTNRDDGGDKTSQQHRPRRNAQPCFNWAKTGECFRGAKCWYTHDPTVRRSDSLACSRLTAVGQVATSRERCRQRIAAELQRLRQEQAEEEEEARRLQFRDIIRRREEEEAAEQRRLEEADEAARRDAAQRLHQERLDAEILRYVQVERSRQRRLAEQANERQRVEDAGRRAREEESEARFQNLARQNATTVLRRFVLASFVTFGAGLEVRNIITGFECSLVKINNLPDDARDREIVGLFTQQGVDESLFQLRSVTPMEDGSGRKEAHVIMTSDLAVLFTSALDGIEFRDERIGVEVGAYNMPGAMGTLTPEEAQTMTVSWRLPSVSYAVEYDDEHRAQVMVNDLNGTVFQGRRIDVEMDMHPSRAYTVDFSGNVKISRLPLQVTDAQVWELAQTHRVRRLEERSIIPYSGLDELFRRFLAHVNHCTHGSVISSERVVKDRDVSGRVTYRIRFVTPEQARVAYERFFTQGFPGLHKLRLVLPEPTTFNLTISRLQYAAQKTQWDALAAGLTDRKACSLLFKEDSDLILIRLSGSAQPIVGALKVRIEGLAAGERVKGWHQDFEDQDGPFCRRVFRRTRAFLRGDRKTQSLRLCGSAASMEAGREMVRTELARLSSMGYTITLRPESVDFFSRRGVSVLKELYGEGSVTFVPRTRRITITEGEDARHHLRRLVDESLDEGRQGATTTENRQQCPVCSDEVSAAFRLGCGHVYCSSCINHFLTSAVDNGQFPLLCIGNDMTCSVPIAIPTIEQFLPPYTFNRLLESATESYMSQNSTIFKHCKTPGCTQVFRSSDEGSATTLQCPSCFTGVCSVCGEDPHETVSCVEQRRAQQWDINDAWMQEQGIRKCPSCSMCHKCSD